MTRPWPYIYYNNASTLNFSTDFIDYPLDKYGIFATEPRVGTGNSVVSNIVIDDRGYIIFSADDKTFCLDPNGPKSGTSYTDAAIIWTRDHRSNYVSCIGDECYLSSGGTTTDYTLYAVDED